VKRVSAFLITLALIAGMAGCIGTPAVEIRDWYDLDAIRDNLGGSYILMNDLNSTTAGYDELAGPDGNEGMGWLPIGTEDDAFGGSLDGQGYEIRDLFIHGFGAPHVGVFGFVDEGGQVEDVGVVDADVYGHEFAGGLVGVCNGTVINSYSTASVDSHACAGGLVGLCHGTVTNSYSTGIVTSDGIAGGLVGASYGTVTDSYSTGSVTSEVAAGGLVGGSYGTVSHCHASGTVTGGWVFVGGLVGMNEGAVTNSYSGGDVTGGIDGSGVGGLVGGNGYSGSGTVANSYSTGSVTGEDLVGGLVGGNNHESIVSNCYATGHVNGNRMVGGLVGLNGGTVSDSYSAGGVAGDRYFGGLVGENYDGTAINSFYNYDEVLINGENMIMIGALFGEDFHQWLADGKFLDVNEMLSQESGYYVISNVDDFKHLLAFCQDNSLKFRLINDLDFATEPNLYIPYLAGEFDGNGHRISNLSFNFDFVSGVGLFGHLAPGAEVTHLGVESANITGDENVGALVGENYGTVSDSYSTGIVTGYRYVGGLVGENGYEGIVSDSYTIGNVEGVGLVGGLVGKNEGTLGDSCATGSVTGEENVGGLVGWNDCGAVTESCATVSVTGEENIGGLVGWNYDATVSSSYSTGSVTGYKDVGGLMGQNEGGGAVSNSYSTGSVGGNSSVGGLIGFNLGTVSDSYSTGSVAGNSSIGGLVGDNSGTVSDSFWDIETSGQATSDGGTGKTTVEMQNITTFMDTETEGLDEPWDITTVVDIGERNPSYIWNIVNNVTYPFLSWES
jgi:hypothetical protein